MLEAHEAEAAKVCQTEQKFYCEKALNLPSWHSLGEKISARQQGAVQQSGAEAGGLEQVHGTGEEG